MVKHRNCSVQFRCSVVSNSLRPYEPHSTPGLPVHHQLPEFTQTFPLSQWCHPSLSSLTFIMRLFSSSLLSALRVVSSVYLKLLIFLLAMLIPACASSRPAFLMIYSACKINKQGDNIQPWHTPSQFATSLLFHVLFWMLLFGLHTDFSSGSSGGLVFSPL